MFTNAVWDELEEYIRHLQGLPPYTGYSKEDILDLLLRFQEAPCPYCAEQEVPCSYCAEYEEEEDRLRDEIRELQEKQAEDKITIQVLQSKVYELELNYKSYKEAFEKLKGVK